MDILVCGNLNVETSMRVEAFPLAYASVSYRPFALNSRPSGVGYNLTRALTVLGNNVRFASLAAQDFFGQSLRAALAADGIADEYVLSQLPQTPQSVVMYDAQGRRAVHTDLKDLQHQTYPPQMFGAAVQGCALAVMSNVYFSRALLPLAKQAGALIATDVHTVSDLECDHNADFMAAADILFMSHEHLPDAPEVWLSRVLRRYPARVAVVGLGGRGALLGVRGEAPHLVPAVATRPVVNTVGAGDALLASFLHFYLRSGDARAALRRAVVFASYKVGADGASTGFLTAEELERTFATLTA